MDLRLGFGVGFQIYGFGLKLRRFRACRATEKLTTRVVMLGGSIMLSFGPKGRYRLRAKDLCGWSQSAEGLPGVCSGKGQ